ncbi:P63C domain-containing protein [Acidiferrimicrobium sp. IK]|uniref:P63C domain-containing protein n=1 Tax=Acidiferrimicrobium sp. IK TaxID=2871700 RepID=UPI0021CB4CF4|nr:P63C domain-containing protein [Acidiferrimicrobium sp. IK]MCU4183954.1 P63C domain-containing protein [Acidiferrimicrobium sp. IK]
MAPDKSPDLTSAAGALSRQGASKGGKARAERLTEDERKEIARNAALARWGSDLHVATHEGELQIGDQSIACAVLEDGTRVLSQATMLVALGRHSEKSRRGVEGDKRPPFLSAANLQRFITPAILEKSTPIAYRPVSPGGRAWGYQAELLPMVCDVYLQARRERVLVPSQRHTAASAEVLVRGLAMLGIVALVDEATGYQETRARNELQQILARYVQAELRPWTKMFPDEFFREIYRLQGWEYRPGTAKRTPYVGHLVNKYIYEQLPPGVLDELRRLNPRNEHGNRSKRFHQFLTADTGNPHLDKQISTITTLLRISSNKTEFESLFERAFPPIQPRLPFVVPLSSETPDEGEESATA